MRSPNYGRYEYQSDEKATQFQQVIDRTAALEQPRTVATSSTPLISSSTSTVTQPATGEDGGGRAIFGQAGLAESVWKNNCT